MGGGTSSTFTNDFTMGDIENIDRASFFENNGVAKSAFFERMIVDPRTITDMQNNLFFTFAKATLMIEKAKQSNQVPVDVKLVVSDTGAISAEFVSTEEANTLKTREDYEELFAGESGEIRIPWDESKSPAVEGYFAWYITHPNVSLGVQAPAGGIDTLSIRRSGHGW